MVPVDDFDPSPLARKIPSGNPADLSRETLSGPLRMGGRGKEQYRIVGRSALHNLEGNRHYHFSVTATRASKPFAAPEKSPTLADFYGAIAEGVSSGAKVDVVVAGNHLYPPEWWRRTGGLYLPVPVVPSSEGRVQDEPTAQLTGFEVTYSDGESVLITRGDEHFFATTMFEPAHPVTADLFNVAVEHSGQIAGRWFGEPDK